MLDLQECSKQSLSTLPPDWTDPERWVCEQALKGEIADFNVRYGTLDPGISSGWSAHREVRAHLFDALLLDDSFRKLLKRQGVRIVGAWIREHLSLAEAHLTHEVRIERSRIEGAVCLSQVRSTHGISFDGSVFLEAFKMKHARFDGMVEFPGATFRRCVEMEGIKLNADLDMSNVNSASLDLKYAAIEGNVTLVNLICNEDLGLEGARIAGYLSAAGASRIGSANCERIKVGGYANFRGLECSGSVSFEGGDFESDLFLGGRELGYQARYLDLSLAGASVGGQLSMIGTVCEGNCDMQGLTVAADLYMQSKEQLYSRFNSVELTEAKIGNQLDMDDVSCTGDVDMQGIDVGTDLYMRGKFQGVALTGAKIGGQLLMSGVVCRGRLSMQALSIVTDLFMGTGSEFAEVNLMGAKVGGQLDLEDAKCSGALKMQSLVVGESILMNNSKFSGKLELGRLETRGSLLLRNIEATQEVSLRRVTTGDTLDLTDATIAGSLDLYGARVGGDLRMRRASEPEALRHVSQDNGSVEEADSCAEKDVGAPPRCLASFKSVLLRNARVSGYVDMDGATCHGMLDMFTIDVGGYLYMRKGARFCSVDLSDAKIHGSVIAYQVTFNGPVNLDALRADYLWLKRDASFLQSVTMLSGEIVHDVDLSGANFASKVDFSGSRVGGSLILDSDADSGTRWSEASQFDLRNVELGILRDAPRASLYGLTPWPKVLRVTGFNFKRLGGGDEDDAYERWVRNGSSDWYLEWLRRARPYSIQPYRHLARILGDQGASSMADVVLFRGMDEFRRESEGLRRAGLSVMRWSIGYGIGYRYFWSLGWALLLTVVGTFIFEGSPSHTFAGHGDAFLFSLDQVLPVVKISPGSDKIAESFAGYWKCYLAFHRVMGFLLGSFVVAGLAGITKKN